jgi:hypothetical protein
MYAQDAAARTAIVLSLFPRSTPCFVLSGAIMAAVYGGIMAGVERRRASRGLVASLR